MYESIDKLIIVAGHAAFNDSLQRVPDDSTSDEHWALQSFQAGEPLYYVEHIKKGVEFLRDDPSSLLLFSGGRTQLKSGQWSEAATYAAIAKHSYYRDNDRDDNDGVTNRIDLEVYARDSFENLLYSIHRFHDLVGCYPEQVTVVGWRFKQERFMFHAETLGIPPEKFSYIGVNDPVDLHAASEGEEKTLDLFRHDATGSSGQLYDKKIARNPFNEQCPYNLRQEQSIL